MVWCPGSFSYRVWAAAKPSSVSNSSAVRVSDAAATFSARCSGEDVPGIGRIDGRAVQQPREAHLPHVRVVRARDRTQLLQPLSQVAAVERKIRNERDAVCLAMLEHGFARAVADVVVVLHRGDLDDPARALQLVEVDVRESDVADLSRIAQLAQRADLILERNLLAPRHEADRGRCTRAAAGVGCPRTPRRYSGRPSRSHWLGPGRVEAALGRDRQVRR